MKRIVVFVIAIFMLVEFPPILSASEDTEVELQRIVVTPKRMEEASEEATSEVTLIERRQIEKSNAHNIADILKEEAGINIYDSSSDKTVKVDIRGFADTSVSNILVLVDGRKVNSIDISGPDWLHIPLDIVQRIEVIRGAGSVLYGDNAVGGVVNIITKKGKGPLAEKLGLGYGSYNTRYEDVEISGNNEDTSYYIYSKYFETRGYRSNSDVLTKDFNTRFDYDFNEDISLGISAAWHEDDYGMPGGLNGGELEQYGREGSANESDYASTKDRYIKLSGVYKPWFDVRDASSFSLDLSYRNRDAYSWFDYGVWGATATKYMIDTQGVNAKYVYNGDIAGYTMDFILGMDYYDVEHIIKGSGSGVSASSDDLTIYKKEMGFYGYVEHELLKKFFMSTGMRYQRAKYRFDQRASSARYEIRNPEETVLMARVKYEYAHGSNMHFAVQETFRFLATDEWYSTWTGLNTDLKQQTGIQYEMGIKHNISDALKLTITPYIISLKNEIYLNPSPSPGQNENYDRTLRRGVECGLQGKITGINFYVNYTYQEPKFKDGDYSNNDIPMVPRHKINAGLKACLSSNCHISIGGRYVGSCYAINDTRNETDKIEHYIVWDGKVSYEKDSFEIYGAINNIFNRRYYTYVVKSTSSTSKDFYPAEERNFEFGVRYKF